jgi:hypothetical protein
MEPCSNSTAAKRKNGARCRAPFSAMEGNAGGILARVELDDELLVDDGVDFLAAGHTLHGAA